MLESINSKVINQSKVYSTNVPGVAPPSGMTAESVFNSKINEATGHKTWWCLLVEGQVKEMWLETFPKGGK